MDIGGLLNHLIFPALLAFGLYVVKRFDRMQVEVKKTTDAVEADLKEMRDARTAQMQYLHENFVTKETHLYTMGQITGKLADIFDKLDELTKQVALQQGRQEGHD